MVVNIANHGGSIVWDGIYYFAPCDYPNICDWELKNIILFFEYEKKHNRKTEIVCDNNDIVTKVNYALANPFLYIHTPKPSLITVPVCTSCKQGGCRTDYLCHTTEIKFLEPIFKSGKLLSAVNARNKTAKELSVEPRNAAKDTPDYFDYVMFTWGNCFAGDNIVMERMLNRSPNQHDLSVGFMPGARFYFRYEEIVNHSGYVNDGHHAAKIKHELSLLDYLHCCIIPESHKAAYEKIVPHNLADRTFYVKNNCKDIWEWSEKVYDFVLSYNRSNMHIGGGINETKNN
ncbi:MAG: hypothetical protein FWC92_07860 [Defluviitaleaceae bacterium]|nr:hypothetical protein [Defluviitaleaceae bacterium]